MDRMTKDEIRTLSDRELRTAHDRILRDFSLGLLNDRVTPVENTRLLEEELRERRCSASN